MFFSWVNINLLFSTHLNKKIPILTNFNQLQPTSHYFNQLLPIIQKKKNSIHLNSSQPISIKNYPLQPTSINLNQLIQFYLFINLNFLAEKTYPNHQNFTSTHHTKKNKKKIHSTPTYFNKKSHTSNSYSFNLLLLISTNFTYLSTHIFQLKNTSPNYQSFKIGQDRQPETFPRFTTNHIDFASHSQKLEIN